ncbi:MAG: flavodoxin domain-containing protein [Phyllobacterium sp.]
MNITILYGTETGNAEMLAEDIGADLENEHDVSIRNLDGFKPVEFDTDRFYLIICSTYGDGELPASAQPFAEAMAQSRPDLSAIRFSVFGLGDREYTDTFNFGSKRLSEIMLGAGARQVGERIVHDASGADMSDDIALPWARHVVALNEHSRETAL